jgi:UDP-galactopyranose mutase
MAELIVVGAGLTGATIARLAHNDGHHVVIYEARDQPGGNVRDAVHASGIRYGLYGPHYFRTSSYKIWEFATRFAEFRPWAAEVMSMVDGKPCPWPLTRECVGEHKGMGHHPFNFEEVCLSIMPASIYERFVKGYTEKQWGVACRSLDCDLAARFEVREGDDRRLKLHRFQALPIDGYAAWIGRMLDGIEVVCGRRRDPRNLAGRVVHTGPIDEALGYKFGKLRYRGQVREHVYKPCAPDQPCVQLNFPDPAVPYVRSIEWLHQWPTHPQLAADYVGGTLLTHEYPFTPEDPDHYEYPFPDRANRELYERYAALAARALPNVIFAGRLGEYRYLDMDQAIARAMTKYERVIKPRLRP